MKCKLLRPMDQKNPKFDRAEKNASEAAIRDAQAARKAAYDAGDEDWQSIQLPDPYAVPKTIPIATGTEIDHPDAWQLVMQGVAEPVDDACRAVVAAELAKKGQKLSAAEIARRSAKYEKLNSGRATGDKRLDAPEVEETAEADDE